MNIEIGQVLIRDGLEYKIININNEGRVWTFRGGESFVIHQDEILKSWTLVNSKWFSKIGHDIFKCNCAGDPVEIKNEYGEYIINAIDEHHLQAELINISSGRLCKMWVNVEVLEL